MKNVKSQWNLLCNGNLKEEKKTKNKKKKKRNLDPNACEFCCKNRRDVQKISNVVELVCSVEMSKNLPCENCRLFYFSRKWFDIGAGNKAVSEAVDSLQRGMDEMKGLREDLR